jgi:hypothetical protein
MITVYKDSIVYKDKVVKIITVNVELAVRKLS